MKLLTLTCQHCGAPLEVPARVTQFKCLFCGSRLYVQWTDSVAHTEALEFAAPQTSHLTKTPEQLRIEGEIDLLDDAWRRIRARFMLPGHDGRLTVPDKINILVACGFGVLLGIVAFAVGITSSSARQSLDPGTLFVSRLLPPLGVLIVIVVVAWSRIAYRRAVDFDVHHHAYQSERQRLLAELEKSPYTVTDPLPH